MNKTTNLRLEFYLSMGIAGLGYLGAGVYVRLQDYANPWFYVGLGFLVIGSILSIRDGKRFFKHLKTVDKYGHNGCPHAEFWKHESGKLYCIKCGDEVKQK